MRAKGVKELVLVNGQPPVRREPNQVRGAAAQLFRGCSWLTRIALRIHNLIHLERADEVIFGEAADGVGRVGAAMVTLL